MSVTDPSFVRMDGHVEVHDLVLRLPAAFAITADGHLVQRRHAPDGDQTTALAQASVVAWEPAPAGFRLESDDGAWRAALRSAAELRAVVAWYQRNGLGARVCTAALAQAEPSMEEILGSIRRIISEDGCGPETDVMTAAIVTEQTARAQSDSAAPVRHEQSYTCPACGKAHRGWLSPGSTYNCACGAGSVSGERPDTDGSGKPSPDNADARVAQDAVVSAASAATARAETTPASPALRATETPPAWTFKSDAVAQKFDDHVREQLAWYEPLSRYVADIAVSFLPTNGTLYDIGASTGNITRLLADDLAAKTARAVSIEPSHQMAKRFTGQGELLVTGAERINYWNERPDVAVAFLTLMFMPPARRETFLQDLMAAVSPGGALILVDKGYLTDPAVQVACKAAHMAAKKRAGTPADSYVTKELSLRGEQRPTSETAIFALAAKMGFSGETIFRFGEFYGVLLVKRCL